MCPPPALTEWRGRGGSSTGISTRPAHPYPRVDPHHPRGSHADPNTCGGREEGNLLEMAPVETTGGHPRNALGPLYKSSAPGTLRVYDIWAGNLRTETERSSL